MEKRGWRVIEVWECQTKPEDLSKLVEEIKTLMKSSVSVLRDT